LLISSFRAGALDVAERAISCVPAAVRNYLAFCRHSVASVASLNQAAVCAQLAGGVRLKLTASGLLFASKG